MVLRPMYDSGMTAEADTVHGSSEQPSSFGSIPTIRRRIRDHDSVAHNHFTTFARLFTDSIKTLAPVSNERALSQSGASNFQSMLSSPNLLRTNKLPWAMSVWLSSETIKPTFVDSSRPGVGKGSSGMNVM